MNKDKAKDRLIKPRGREFFYFFILGRFSNREITEVNVIWQGIGIVRTTWCRKHWGKRGM
jgi:hypothetical protein